MWSMRTSKSSVRDSGILSKTMNNDTIYQTILDSDLMDDIWNSLGATDKVAVLEKSGWELVEEYKKRSPIEVWGSEQDNKNGDSNFEPEG